MLTLVGADLGKSKNGDRLLSLAVLASACGKACRAMPPGGSCRSLTASRDKSHPYGTQSRCKAGALSHIDPSPKFWA
jgi:hypothetical protein